MPGAQLDDLMDIWAAREDGEPPFTGQDDFYSIIDATEAGSIPWQSFSATYSGVKPETDVPPWMLASYDVWYCDPLLVMREQIANPDFNGQMHYCAKRVYGENDEMEFRDLMEGTWAWDQSVCAFL